MADEEQRLSPDPNMNSGFNPFHANWKFVDTFTVHQAAFLWCGYEPVGDFPTGAGSLPHGYRAISQLLSDALPAEKKAEFRFDLFGTAKAPIARRSLMELAEQKKVYPPFLFDTAGPVPNTPTGSTAKGGRPPEFNWDRILAGVVMLEGLESLPGSLDRLADEMIEFVENGYSFRREEGPLEERAPSKTQMKYRLRGMFNALKALGWSSVRDGNAAE